MLQRSHAVLLSLGLLLAAAIDEILIDEYHRGATETFKAVYLAGFAALTIIALTLGLLGRRPSVCHRGRLGAVLVSIAAWLWIVFLPRGGHYLENAPIWLVTCVAFLCVVGLFVADQILGRMIAAIWAPLLVAAFGFVLSPAILVCFLAPSVQWPPSAALVPASGGEKNAVIYLLFDEMSANASEGITDELQEHGLNVKATAIGAIADATAKVIPSMWKGVAFDSARPCGPTAICSDGEMLDFSRVSASRSDIDVVGFFHPYCAMQGLRSCYRGELAPQLFSYKRWSCALQRRMSGATPPECADVRFAHWQKLREELIEAMWRANVWTKGGMLYAHLPLPHPPGGIPLQGTLLAQYQGNLVEARTLVRSMLDKLKENGVSRYTFVVFSDHPLRIGLWCGSGAYSGAECLGVGKYRDDRVPLIVASTAGMPPVSDIRSNDAIFRLGKLAK